MSIGNSVLNLMYGNPLTGLGQGPTGLGGRPGATPSPTGAPGGPSGGPTPSPSAGVSQTPSPATQSPPDLAQLYVQLAQRQQSASGIDRGLTMMAAANASPNMSRSLMASMPGTGGGGLGGGMDIKSLMELQMLQQAANLPPPPGYNSDIWRGLNPMQKQEQYGQQATAIAQQQNKLTEAKQADMLEAQQKAPGAIDQFSRADSLSNQIMNATETNGSNVMQNITSSVLKRNAAQAMIDAQTSEPGKEKGSWAENAAYYLANLTDAEKATINNAIQLNGMVYGEQFANAGSRRTQAEIKGLQSGASQLLAFNQPFSNYQKQFGDFQNKLHTSIANAYGEAGQLDQIPEAYRWDSQTGNPLVNQEYRPNGPLYAGGGDWLKNPPKQQGSPAPANFDYGAIKSGDTYTAPDGTIRRKS